MFTEDEIRNRYADILEMFEGNIKRFCYQHSNNRFDADDLMQEIFAAIWVGLPRLSTDATHQQTNRWLYKLMFSVFIKQLRHRRKLVFMPTDLLPEPPQEEDISERFEELIADLPENNRNLLYDLKHGYSIPEIAQRHNISIAATHMRLARIRDRLRKENTIHHGK